MDELSGILPRTAIFIFKEVQRLQSYIYDEIKVEISALEIYCEEVRDLFSDKIIDLMTDKNRVTQLQNQTWRKVDNPKDFLASI